MASPTTADSGDPSQPLGSLGQHSPPTGHQTESTSSKAPASTRAKRKASGRGSSGARLIAHDRAVGARWVAGADEAGRGCLAGPLVAAAVLLDLDSIGVAEVRALGALNDSKQHDHAAREALLPIVMETAQRVVVVSRSARGIDERGLHKTNLAALREALIRVARPGCVCLIDGFAVPAFDHEQRAVVGGDGLSAAIAAASIVAKVTRDRLMVRAGEQLPAWGFGAHFGYSTAAHREAIIEHGVSPLHRMSFQSSAYEQLAQ